MSANLKWSGIAAIVAVSVSPAAAQTPQRTTATYGDWTVRCEMGAEEGAKRVCELVQAITVQGQAAPVAQVAIGPATEGGYRLVVQLPLNVWLPTDVKISASEEIIVSAEFKRCFPQFCLAEASLPDAEMEELRKRTGAGAVAFQDAGQRGVSVPLSFNGIADAHAALTAEAAPGTEAPPKDEAAESEPAADRD